MRFHDPVVIAYSLWVTLTLAIFLYWAERVYRKLNVRFADKAMITRLTSSPIGRRRVLKASLDIVAIILIGIAIARPQWGLSWKQKTAQGLDILFAVDVSKSMLARDIQPNRLSYARQEIRNFIERLKGDRVGLIGFSGNAFLFSPLTADYGGFLLVLDNTGVDSVSRGGTSIAAAIKEALRAFSSAPSEQKTLILISDGGETEGDAATFAKAAKKANVEISCIGLGTLEGSNIAYGGESGTAGFIKDENGRIVISKLDETVLAAVANGTGGIYVRARGENFGLEKIYEERLSRMKKHQTEETLSQSHQERFQYPLALAFLALFISTLIGMTEGYEKN